MSGQRTVDPWRETDVIDERAPRFNQLVVGLIALVGILFGWPLLWALMGAQLLIGLTLGRRFCVTCVAYFVLIQPRIGEGRLEDSRPPRFANLVGASVLTGAALAYLLGAEVLGAGLGLLVAALALLASITGFCAGCEAYKIGHLLTGRPFVSCPLPPRPSAARDA
jgi:phosphate/sulfate permease